MMNGKRILYIFTVTAIGFALWLAGEIVLMVFFPESSLMTARIWAIAVFSATCLWNILHFIRVEKKKREEKENDDYKGVY